ncbi:methionine adenosyltransferase [Candidatus Nitrospira neomarina]|uniref:Methionine adenosyltransferase n=1 Tax=Candidatus Nitrospira neomarina TaxID=3020899 RepID=A0AA96GN61_9BACT|nr:methionine adenosyltransferase [Candidatus Nitrospira neomarina]WNM62253.1 methionine adenosyltransferase [Candidatus Nitrospira neomarina]
MKTRILIHQAPAVPVDAQPLEIVERKGKGHPDTICDALAEAVSIQLSKVYQETFGRILHHNIDKCLLVAGQVKLHLGGGRVTHPMRLILGDRASFGVPGKTIPVSDIAVETARTWIKSHLPNVNPDTHMRYQIELQPTSAELGAIFEHGSGVLPANDTSAGVGYAPLTPTERLVVDLEQYVNGTRFKRAFPETGEDVKVMAVRMDWMLSLTVAMPFLAKRITTEKAYFARKAKVLQNVQRFINEQPHSCKRVDVVVNALDRPGQGLKGMYLTLLGTSAEQGDSGQVGRGNRISGVIALNRPMSGEAAAGKNPVSHVGKIYNVWARELALKAYEQIPGVRDATVWMVSRIGAPVNEPLVVSAQVGVKKGFSLKRISGEVQELIKHELADMESFCDNLAKGQFGVY